MRKNRDNFRCFNNEQDYSHKTKGQSQEFLPNQAMAIEQLTSFIQQGLVELGDWWTPEPQVTDPENLFFSKSDVKKLTNYHLEKLDYLTVQSDAVKSGLLGSLIILKVHGCFKNKPIYRAENDVKSKDLKPKLVKIDKKVWELKIDVVRQEDFYPDPSGRGLYIMEDSYLDYYEVLRMAQGPNAVYDEEVVKKLKDGNRAAEDDWKKDEEIQQNPTTKHNRRQIKITECWGNIIDDNGELLYENVVWTIANDNWLIRKPTPNPMWHGSHPYIAEPVMRIPNSVWHKAVADAGTQINFAKNELFNLALDGAMMGVHGIKQVYKDWLDDPSKLTDGIAPGDSIVVNERCPPGAQAYQRVDTASIPSEAFNFLQMLNSEQSSAMLSNEARQGLMSMRSVKATEIVESSNSITGMLRGFSEVLEQKVIERVIELSWMTIVQHIKYMDRSVLDSLFGRERAQEILNKGPEALFAETVNGYRYKVFGISRNLKRQQDFTKLTAFLQTVASSELFIESFLKRFDMSKLLTEIMKSLDIDEEAIKQDQQFEGAAEDALAGAMNQGPDMQSQIPQAGADANNTQDEVQSNIQRAEFPGSPATKGQ
jgi:hypothetical protein